MDVQGILSRIENRLKEIGMSKEEFYKLSGISSATYSYWNTGKYNPTPKKLRPAADVIGIDYFYLLTGENKKEIPAPEGAGIDAETIELKEIWETATADERALLIDIARSLKKRRSN